MDPSKPFGDEMHRKNEDTIRIISVQINSFPTTSEHKDIIKRNALQQIITTTEADIIMIQEDNRYWPNVYFAYRPQHLARQWLSLEIVM